MSAEVDAEVRGASIVQGARAIVAVVAAIGGTVATAVGTGPKATTPYKRPSGATTPNNPSFYQLEDPSSNRSHQFEQKP